MAHVCYKQGDFRGAVHWARRADAQSPSFDSAWMIAWVLALVGRPSEAREFAQRAFEVDPMNEMCGFARGGVEFQDGRFDEAERWFRRYLKAASAGNPMLLWWQAHALAYTGRLDEATALHQELAHAGTEVMSDLSSLYCLASDGDRDRICQALDPGTRLYQAALTDEWYPNFIAACLAMVGDHEGAVEWLERAVAWGFSNHRFLGECSPFLAPLRGHPRFERLLEQAREKERAFEL